MLPLRAIWRGKGNPERSRWGGRGWGERQGESGSRGGHCRGKAALCWHQAGCGAKTSGGTLLYTSWATPAQSQSSRCSVGSQYCTQQVATGSDGFLWPSFLRIPNATISHGPPVPGPWIYTGSTDVHWIHRYTLDPHPRARGGPGDAKPVAKVPLGGRVDIGAVAARPALPWG